MICLKLLFCSFFNSLLLLCTILMIKVNEAILGKELIYDQLPELAPELKMPQHEILTKNHVRENTEAQ